MYWTLVDSKLLAKLNTVLYQLSLCRQFSYFSHLINSTCILLLVFSNNNYLVSADEIDNHSNLKLLPKECGEINEDHIIRDTAQFEELPWMTLITIQSKISDEKVRFGCSGTLINSKYVLTVGHCAKFATGVRIGEHDITTTTDCEGDGDGILCALPHQDVEIEEIIIYPEYNAKNHSDDIALLRLKEAVNFENPNVGAICLPTTSNLRNLDLSKEQGTLAGWRLLQNPSSLKKSKATIYSDEDCKKLFSKLFRKEVQQPFNNLCVEGFLNLESGAPLMIKSPFQDYRRYAQYGILSSGPKNSATGIFTDVRKYLKWILDTIKA